MKTKLLLAGGLYLTCLTPLHAQYWSLTGDAGTVDGTNFIGTTDNVPFTIRVNNQQAGRIDHLLYNTLFGYEAGNSITGAGNTSAFGWNALKNLTTGYGNCAFGKQALQNVTTTGNSSAFGSFALANNTASSNNAFGASVLIANTTGYNNCGFGTGALGSNITGASNVAIGQALAYSTNASYNIAIGDATMFSNASGNNNIAMGFLSMLSNVTGDANICIGHGSDISGSNYTNGTALGAYAVVNASDKIRLGDGNVTVIEGQPAMYTSSDGRFKTNLSEADVKGLDFIKRLRPVVYNFEIRKFEAFLRKNEPDSIKRNYFASRDFSKATAIRRSGFIAQEVEKAALEAGYDFDGIHTPVDANDNYSLAYGEFVVPIVKAMQEQQAIIENMQANDREQKQTIASLETKLNELLAQKITGIQETTGNINYGLSQNEPNPFTHETLIKYTLPANISNAYLAVYDLSGKQLTTFAIGKDNASAMTITSEKLSAGIYIYSIVANGKVLDSKRMIVADK